MREKKQSSYFDTRIKIPTKAQEAPEPFDNVERIGVSVRRAAKMLDLSERHVWTLVKEEKIRSVKSGTRIIVSVQSFPCDCGLALWLNVLPDCGLSPLGSRHSSRTHRNPSAEVRGFGR